MYSRLLERILTACAVLAIVACGGNASNGIQNLPRMTAAQSTPFLVDLSNWNNSTLWKKSDGYAHSGAWAAGFRADHAIVAGSILSLQLDTIPCPASCSAKPYAVGRIASNALYSYGYYQIDMQVPKGSGLLSGFDVYANSTPNGPQELDDYISVNVAGENPNQVILDYSGKGIEGGPFTINLGFDASSATHRYAFSWTSSAITWFVDGKNVYTVKTSSRHPVPTTPSTIELILRTAGTPGIWFGPFTYSVPVDANFASASFSPPGAATPGPTPAPIGSPTPTPIGSPTPMPTPGGSAHARSLWVWTTPDNATLIRFAQAHGISEIFYSVSSNVNVAGTENTRISDLHTRAVAAGIVLDALSGDPTWADNGAGTASAIAWENNAMGTGFFVGAHFDIEPSPALNTSCNVSEANAFISALDRIHNNGALHGWDMNEDMQIGNRLCTGVAGGYATLTDAIIAKTDQITVMSYRNVASGGNGMWDVCQDAIARARAAGKPARCGAEPANDTPLSITFYGSTATIMGSVLAQVDALAGQSPSASSYRGIAIEDYAGYAALAP
jgi:beta-glucanase (GH16 family)